MKRVIALLMDRRTAALLFFPIALQLHLEALSALGFIYIPAAVLFAIVVLVMGVAHSLMSRGRTAAPPPLQGAAYAVLAMIAGSALQAAQRSENTRRGIIVANAVEAYRSTHRSWPATLDGLDAHLPRWRYGILEYDFIYWIDQQGPRLKFCAGGTTGVIYSFDTKRWGESTL